MKVPNAKLTGVPPTDDSALQERLAAERERCAKELERLNYPNFAHAALAKVKP